MQNIFRLSGIILVAIVLLASCSSTSNNTPATETIAWQVDGNGFIQYRTNDTAEYGYGYYISVSTSSQGIPASYPGGTVTAIVEKMSGSANYGYGIIFCYQDTNNYYRFLISENGGFQFDKKVAGTYTILSDWASSSNINQGYGIQNTISVNQTAAGTFAFYINNMTVPVLTCSDSSFNSGYAGYYIAIGPSTSENFPTVAADVRFKLTAPVISPGAAYMRGEAEKREERPSVR
jgi:hypothetical protein